MTTSATSATAASSSTVPSGNIDTTQQEDTPRDVRLLHLLLASQAIHQYEDQVPLQLMDFAYRYTRGVLKDAMIHDSGKKTKKGLTVEDIRLAIAARTQYQFKPTAPKELMLQLAADRNKKALPQVMGSWGIRLPPEKYCLTAKEWDIEENNTSSNQ
ncbi:similar to Saccharomyces cerevisiae YMR236W TAF9 Subunit (17 kDa) of TFIID and SAGA complexes [Maudiozyma saulgeensis]|uniref:Similar to Saccharomyces cerevisiae YMR236W TAF9 Subunit (17 kDa) of TFIID and SAGA complexes n=1 Tax=Maudiozyma saulgeensis TaxID=1789683 RepID=A0A1X7R8R3_9SACH|nr:similar to Saccharomyces cerevisiae YMR236W TAF9 Subunit (17 kDa) of TFIID and SAGA complexes [Kazachstania saulgeensis]